MSVEHVGGAFDGGRASSVPKMIGELSFEVHSHQGKADLLGHLLERLRGYASWIPPTWRIVVVVDRDDDKCGPLKARIEKMAADTGLVTRSVAKEEPHVVVNRLAIEELEAWYFGDWEAVCAAYPRALQTILTKAKYLHYKNVLDTMRAALANIESELAVLLAPHLSRPREGPAPISRAARLHSVGHCGPPPAPSWHNIVFTIAEAPRP